MTLDCEACHQQEDGLALPSTGSGISFSEGVLID
jgi:hypothetical protein